MADKGRLRRALDNFLLDFDFGELIRKVVLTVEESKEAEFVLFIDGLLSLLIEVSKDIPELNAVYSAAKNKKHQVALTLMSGLASSAGSVLMSGVSSPIVNKMNQEINMKMQKNILDAQAYMQYSFLHPEDEKTIVDRFARHGLDRGEKRIFQEIMFKRLDVPQLLQIGLRFPEEMGQIEPELLRRGWDMTSLDYLKKMKYQWPSIQDWIQFAVREATNEEQVKQLGLDLDMPQLAQIEAEKSGLAPGLFKYYWRSHWQLPSVTHAFEFLHRLRPGRANVSFTMADFGGLLKALDISPKWHDYYRAVSYAPIGRVDLRRIYKTTHKDRQWLIDAYQDVDFAPTDAETMADWTIIDAEQSMRDASLETIAKSIKRGIIDESEAQVMLEALRYGDDDIDIYLRNWRFAREEERISAEIDYLKTRFLSAEIDESELRSQLNQLGLTPNNIAIAVANLKTQRARQVIPLTPAQVQEMYEQDIIDFPTVLFELEARGTTKINATRLAKLVDIKVQAKRQKELQAEEKELASVRANEARTDKQLALAEVQVQIAELQAETADLKVIFPDLTETDMQTAVQSRLLQIKQEIAYLQLEKTKVNLTYSRELKTNA